MPQEFLTTPERLLYQTVPAGLLEVDIRQHFHLTEADRTFLTSFPGVANRLGLALQLGVLRLMRFLPEAWASQLPPEVVVFVATQLATEVIHLADYGAPANAQRPFRERTSAPGVSQVGAAGCCLAGTVAGGAGPGARRRPGIAGHDLPEAAPGPHCPPGHRHAGALG